MAWKPKEKDLTPAEAVALARRELLPHWYGATPLIAAVRGATGEVAAHPLDAELLDRRWILLFCEPATLALESALDCVREYDARYSALDVGHLLILSGRHVFLREREKMENLLKAYQVPCGVVADFDQLLAEAFRVKRLPKIILLSKGQSVLEQEGFDDPAAFEGEVQKFLRKTDPGLPLLPVFQPGSLVREVARVDFRAGTEFRSGVLELIGQWTQREDRIETHDPKASLNFVAPSAGVAISAATGLKIATVRIRVQVDESPVHRNHVGADLTVDDEGQSQIEAGLPRAYHMLKSLAPGTQVGLTFPHADRGGVLIYGLRFHD